MITKLLLLCGGPSPERNISLNSARTVYDHLEKEFDLDIVFIDKNLRKFSISGGFLYSNTTTDFDFKLKNEGTELDEHEFEQKLKNSDIILPIMHGEYAEDGQIQKGFEKLKISFIGSGSETCEKIYDKKNAEDFLQKNVFFTLPKIFVNKNSDLENKILNFFKENNLNECIVKPVRGGSSFGIRHIKNVDDAVNYINNNQDYNDFVVEKRCFGKEFTVIVLQNKNTPVALMPTEIEVKDKENIIFDTRRKYLATNETHYHCPPRFSTEIINKIRENSEKLFSLTNAKDFLRIDGWLLDDGNLYFSDFNPISGMEQNSFIFQQASKIGMTHKEVLNFIIDSCAFRNNIKINKKNTIKSKSLKKVNVIFGGTTSERQVSLLSGSNVWLKLLKSDNLNVTPFLLYKEDINLNDALQNFKVLKLPYHMVLNHTVEEIIYQYRHDNSEFDDYINNIRKKLDLKQIKFEHPKSSSLLNFLKSLQKDKAYLFIALHGGFGENGDFQKILERMRIKFNGSREAVAKLCMNKFNTGKTVNSMNLRGVRSAKQRLLNINFIQKNEPSIIWHQLLEKLGEKIIIKPNCDGSSSGIVPLETEKDFANYLNLIKNKSEIIPKNTFKSQESVINMGKNTKELLIEEFIETDKITIKDGKIGWNKKTGWLELTVGVLEKKHIYHALNPSITVAENLSILSVEEKFQGGTGINITPPPKEMINENFLKKIKKNLAIVSKNIGVKDYCRIDIFANVITEEMIIIEFNTLPALTPSTVIFQQAAKESEFMNPLDFILKITNI
jgi:D-alanine--D-alanine ligase